jgi:sulfite reductase (NADPH) flavoprotein alpha-component
MLFRLSERHNLTPQLTHQARYRVRLSADAPIAYQVGDWLSVAGENPPQLVEQVLTQLGCQGHEPVRLRRVGDVTLAQALGHALELTQLDPAILNRLVRQYHYSNWSNRGEMQAYAQGKDVLDLLHAFPALAELGAAFIDLLSPLAPRYYSIASAPQNSPHSIDLIFKHLQFERDGRQRQGVVSSWLSQQPIGATIAAEVKPNAHFKPPHQASIPIIMLAAGTGLAPFIGFMQHRLAQSAHQNWLLFGEAHAASHFLCHDQLTAWQQQGALKLSTAFSRDQADKIYVQDSLWQARDTFIDWWQQGAHVYVCGHKSGMGQAVETTIKRIWQQAFNWDDDTLNQAWLSGKQQGRLQFDLY